MFSVFSTPSLLPSSLFSHGYFSLQFNKIIFFNSSDDVSIKTLYVFD
nr:MAG TPA: hypothetical protein [Caudoviricetes sp.]